jgi:rRNA biogenesis protein RRP5
MAYILKFKYACKCYRIKYMAFYIAKSDHDKAREIAKRALEKINFREEAERLNVYLAWFNMENACKNEEEAEKVN